MIACVRDMLNWGGYLGHLEQLRHLRHLEQFDCQERVAAFAFWGKEGRNILAFL